MGKVVLVGAGPGDFELITVKGLKYIEKADCIIYDRLIGERVLDMANEGCERIYVGKENHHHVLEQDKINELILKKAGEVELVVRLKGGDPYVFGRGGEEALYLRERGVDVDIVPGISSPIAVLAYAGIPITHRGLSKGFHVVTSHSKKDEMTGIDYTQYMDPKETCVFLMGFKHIKEIAENMIVAGRSKDTPAAVISNGTRNNQKKCIGTLENIYQKVEENGINPPAIVVVGEVVGLNEELAFFEKRPLFGKKYLIPYISGGHFSFERGWECEAGNALGDRLEELGAEVVPYKTGIIKPVEFPVDEVSKLGCEDFLVLTSQNAVHAFMWNIYKSGSEIRKIGNAKIAVVGKKTERAVKNFGLSCDIVSDKATAAGLGEVIAPMLTPDTKVVWLAANETSKGLEEKIADKCSLKKIVCYKNEDISRPLNEEEIEAIGRCEGVFFTSGSNVERMIAKMQDVSDEAAFPKGVYSIGKTCSRCLEKNGITKYKEAGVPSYDSLIELLWDE